MKTITTSLSLLGLFGLCAGFSAAIAAESLAEKIKVEIESVGLHPGMQPGLYVCASGHLHIKGTVQNLADVPLGKIKVAGKAFDANGNLLGTATASTKKAALPPGERGEINLEFLTVTGAMLDAVKRHEVTVLEASAKPER
jgi:hypothetical protein